MRSEVTKRRSGAKRSRTADLLSAIQALYQLSYSPWNWRRCTIPDAIGSVNLENQSGNGVTSRRSRSLAQCGPVRCTFKRDMVRLHSD